MRESDRKGVGIGGSEEVWGQWVREVGREGSGVK